MTWQEQAACRGMDANLFHAPNFDDDKNHNDHYTTGRLVCARCPVRQECLEFALSPPRQMHGLWGGMSPRERRPFARRKRNVA